jgi:ABC-type multidrug transport system ATPase subunit
MSLLVGRNGAGKSTFLKTLCGLLQPLGKAKVSRVPSVYLSDEVSFPRELSAASLFKALLGRRVREAMMHAEMLEVDTEKPYERLSKGNRQKVNILLTEGIAVCNRVRLILYDEPLNGLDWPAVTMLLRMFKGEIGRFSRNTHRLLAMHPLAVDESIFSQVLLIERGEIRVGRLSEYQEFQETLNFVER